MKFMRTMLKEKGELMEHLVCYVDKEDDTIRFVNKIVSKRDGERAEFPLELGDKWEEVK